MYRIFVRTWWRENPSWPNGLEPHPGKQRTIRKNVPTIQEARRICAEWNAQHPPGRLSRKAEFEMM